MRRQAKRCGLWSLHTLAVAAEVTVFLALLALAASLARDMLMPAAVPKTYTPPTVTAPSDTDARLDRIERKLQTALDQLNAQENAQ